MEMPKVLYTISTVSSLGGGCTTVHQNLDELFEELNNQDDCYVKLVNDKLIDAGFPAFEEGEFLFEEFAKLCPSEIGWYFEGWDYNERGEQVFHSLNVSVHGFNGKYFVTDDPID